MISLLKADLYRILKSKLTYISLAVMLLFPIVMVLLYYFLDLILVSQMADAEAEAMQITTLLSGRSLLSSVYSITQNAGLVVVVFGTIFISMDVSNGTLRNKITVGHSRSKIYLSHFLATSIYNVVMITAYALMTFLCACAILKYGKQIDAAEFKFLAQWLLAGTVMFIWIASLASFFMLVFKNVALSIIFTIVLGMFITIAASLASGLLEYSWGSVVYFIPTMVSTLLNSPGYDIKWLYFLYQMLSYTVLISLNCLLGIYLFKKHDIK